MIDPLSPDRQVARQRSAKSLYGSSILPQGFMKINFGLFAPILSEQLKEQKMFIKDSENYDKTIDCMNRLWVEDYVTVEEREKIFEADNH